MLCHEAIELRKLDCEKIRIKEAKFTYFDV